MARQYVNKHLVTSNTDTGVTIYSAFDSSLRQQVCIKELRFPSAKDASDGMKEPTNQMRISHPYICQVFDIFTDSINTGVRLSIVMEWLGGDGRQAITHRRNRNMPWTEVGLRTLLMGFVDALKKCQEEKLSHRDLKPENIFIDSSGTAKIGDFGNSKLMERKTLSPQTIVGTLNFLSPILRAAYQQFMYSGQYQAVHDVFKSDVYSLGVCFTCFGALKNSIKQEDETYQEAILKEIWALPYTDAFKSVIGWMVREQEADRPDFIQLHEYLTQTLGLIPPEDESLTFLVPYNTLQVTETADQVTISRPKPVPVRKTKPDLLVSQPSILISIYETLKNQEAVPQGECLQCKEMRVRQDDPWRNELNEYSSLACYSPSFCSKTCFIAALYEFWTAPGRCYMDENHPYSEDQTWKAHLDVVQDPYYYYSIGSFCSYQCWTALHQDIEKREVRFCLNCNFICPKTSIAVLLPCTHGFCKIDCFFAFLRSCSDQFQTKKPVLCPFCHRLVPEETILAEIRRRCPNASCGVYMQYCAYCLSTKGLSKLRCDHCVCDLCLDRFSLEGHICPSCQSK